MSDEPTPIDILNAAVAEANAMNVDCSGFVLQSSPEGFVAWLYIEDEEGQWPLFEEVDGHLTPQAAALWVLNSVRAAGEAQEG